MEYKYFRGYHPLTRYFNIDLKRLVEGKPYKGYVKLKGGE